MAYALDPYSFNVGGRVKTLNLFPGPQTWSMSTMLVENRPLLIPNPSPPRSLFILSSIMKTVSSSVGANATVIQPRTAPTARHTFTTFHVARYRDAFFAHKLAETRYKLSRSSKPPNETENNSASMYDKRATPRDGRRHKVEKNCPHPALRLTYRSKMATLLMASRK